MAFKFRYASLLNYRNHLKEKAEIEYAKALGALLRAREELSLLKRKHARVREAFQLAVAAAAGGNEVQTYCDYLSYLSKSMKRKDNEIETLQTALEGRRGVLLERSKGCKVIETLKEKDSQKWHQWQDHLEQIRLTEVALQRHGKDFP